MIGKSAFLIRADATPQIGAGHVMRCLAIAEALADRGQDCHFAMAQSLAAVERRLAAERLPLHRVEASAASLLDLARRLGARAMIIDGYHFDAAWRQAIRAAGVPILAFDDHAGAIPLHADLVVNAAGDPRRASAHDLLGPDYVLIRRELRLALSLPPIMRDRVLVSFGGTDPARLTLPVTRALSGSGLPLDIVIGGGVHDAAALAEAVTSLGARAHLDPPAMGGLMRSAGLAVSAAGGTLAELAAFQVPALVAVVAENQRIGGAKAAAAGWAEIIDASPPEGPNRLAAAAMALWADPARRHAMAARAAGLIDGRGAERVADALIAAAAKT